MARKVFVSVYGPGFDSSKLVGDQLMGFSFLETITGLSRFKIKVETQNATQWDRFIKNDETPFRLTFGTDYDVDAPPKSSIKSLRTLLSSRKLISNAKAQYIFSGTCNGIALKLHRAKDKVWKDQTISDIARELIQDAGLEADVERTEGKFTLAGCNIPTSTFLLNELLPKAYSQQGRDWRLWVENGTTVHFGPTKPTSGDPLKITNLIRDDWICLAAPRVIRDTRNIEKQRSGKIEVRMFDQKQGRLISKEVGENRGDFNYFGSGRPKERKHTSETIIASVQKDRHTDLRPDTVVQQMAETIWGQHGRSLYRLIGECPYEPGIAVNKLAYVELSGPLGASDVNSGMWVVEAVKTLNVSGRMRTWVVLQKRWER